MTNTALHSKCLGSEVSASVESKTSEINLLMIVAERQRLHCVDTGAVYHVTWQVLAIGGGGGHVTLGEALTSLMSSVGGSFGGNQYQRGNQRHGATCYHHEHSAPQSVARLTSLRPHQPRTCIRFIFMSSIL